MLLAVLDVETPPKLADFHAWFASGDHECLLRNNKEKLAICFCIWYITPCRFSGRTKEQNEVKKVLAIE